jgi:hypothetical protein
MLKIRTISDKYNEQCKRKRKEIVVFVADPERPFDKGDLVGDFIWRRVHKKKYSNEEILDAIEPVLASKGLGVTKIRYDKYAGCSICPCSPGYVVTVEPGYDGGKIAVWLEEENSK